LKDLILVFIGSEVNPSILRDGPLTQNIVLVVAHDPDASVMVYETQSQSLFRQGHPFPV
jgi:hypothetical protein